MRSVGAIPGVFRTNTGKLMPTRSGRHFSRLTNGDGVACQERQRCKAGPCVCWVEGVLCNFCTRPISSDYPGDEGLKYGGLWKTPNRPNGNTWVGHVCYMCWLSKHSLRAEPGTFSRL